MRSGADLKLVKKINMTGDIYSAYSVGDKLITKVAHEVQRVILSTLCFITKDVTTVSSLYQTVE